MVLRCDLVSIFWLKYGIEDAGIKKAGIFYLIFSQKMGINTLGGPLWKSYPGNERSREHSPGTNVPHSDYSFLGMKGLRHEKSVIRLLGYIVQPSSDVRPGRISDM